MLLICSSRYRELSTPLDLNKSIKKAQVCLLLFCKARKVFKSTCALELVSLKIHLVDVVFGACWGRPRLLYHMFVFVVGDTGGISLQHRRLLELERTISHFNFIFVTDI